MDGFTTVILSGLALGHFGGVALGVVFSAGLAARFGRGIARWQPRLRRVTGLVLLGLAFFPTARKTLGLLG